MKSWISLPKIHPWLAASLIGYIINSILTQPALAEAKTKDEKLITNINRLLSQSPAPQPAPDNEIVQVTSVKANPTDKGVEVILQTSKGKELQVTNRSAGNNFIADITGAQLRNNNGEGFRFFSEKPLAGIIEINVTNINANTIRITVVGEASLPTVELFDDDEGLIFGVASSTQQEKPQTQSEKPEAPSNEPIELVVTGEQDGYSVPSSTTGTRTDTPLRDVPASIQVVPQQIIRDQQATRLDEALRNVSGVVGSSAEGIGFKFSIRGFERANILRDGFNLSSSNVSGESGIETFPETANLERIEVLKGPASILYGEINPGGVINLATKKPLAQPFYEAEVQFGSRAFVRPRIDLSGPLTPNGNLLYRLNAVYQRDDGFRDFDTENKRFFVAPVLAWKISDSTDLTLELEYLDDERPYDTGLVAVGNRVINTPRERIFNEPNDFFKTQVLNVGYTLEHRFNSNWRIRNALRYNKQDQNASVAIPLAFNETSGTLTRFDSSIDAFRENYALSTDVVGKFSTGSIKHTLLFGADLSRTFVDTFTGVNLRAPLPLNVFNPVYEAFPRNRSQQVPAFDEKTQTERLGIYLQDQISLTDNLKLLAGFRYDTVNQKLDDAPSFFNPGGKKSQNPDALTPRLGIVYQPIQELSLYASYSRSFTPNTRTTFDGNFLEPEEGEGYEIGVKAELLKEKLFATLAYYDITKQNVASPDPNFPSISGASVATGEQKSRGFEIDLTGEVLPGWNIIASYAYTDAEVTRDNVIDIGNRLVGIPRNSASLWTTYTFRSGDLQGLGLGVGVNYVGERQGDLANSFQLDSYFLTNAAIFYQRNNYRFAINFKNIFDVDYIQGTPFGRTRNIEPGEPFTVIGSVSVQF